MRWATAHRLAMIAASHAHRDLGIDTSHRIDVFRAIDETGLLLGFQPLRALSGVYYAGQGVLVNSQHPLARQRYTAGHELGHFFFKHETSVDPLTDPLARWGTSNRWPAHEKQAEAFSAWFLMPPKLVNASLEQLDLRRPESPEDVYAVALRMGTSFEATARHLPNLKLASSKQVNEWLKVRLAEVKLGLAAGAPPETLQNDVWRLDWRDADSTIAVRRGDRLVVEIKDVPSTGFTWTADENPDLGVVLDSFYDPVDVSVAIDESDVDGDEVTRLVVLEVGPGDASSDEDLVLRRVRPWTGDEVDGYRVHLEVQAPRHGVSEERMRLAA